MVIIVCHDKQELGRRAAESASAAIRDAIQERGGASIILATGVSQFEVLSVLAAAAGIDWGKVTVFHLDEYAGLPYTHPASFRRYLEDRFVSKLPHRLAAFYGINGEGDLKAECQRLGRLISTQSIDVALVGIGENGHLAFNDPPADFETDEPYLVVELDEACRRQQTGEGWFANLEDVPTRAISMSIRQILKSRQILCSAPEQRKARAVKAAVDGPVTPMVPASILQQHPHVTLFVDQASASLLEPGSQEPG